VNERGVCFPKKREKNRKTQERGGKKKRNTSKGRKKAIGRESKKWRGFEGGAARAVMVQSMDGGKKDRKMGP